MVQLHVKGDMLGDKTLIGPEHEARARAVMPKLIERCSDRSAFVVCGPSGSGKSEVAALVGSQFVEQGRGAYVMSLDNYPRRPPRDNEIHRQALYEQGGESVLDEYLATGEEIDFSRVERIIERFKAGESPLPLRIMDNANNRVHDEARSVDFSDVRVLVVEGTWGAKLTGADVVVFLATDFMATLAHRKARARDPLTPFGEVVLKLEQAKLDTLRKRADFILSPAGEFLPE